MKVDSGQWPKEQRKEHKEQDVVLSRLAHGRDACYYTYFFNFHHACFLIFIRTDYFPESCSPIQPQRQL